MLTVIFLTTARGWEEGNGAQNREIKEQTTESNRKCVLLINNVPRISGFYYSL
jgi:hypothetical protein